MAMAETEDGGMTRRDDADDAALERFFAAARIRTPEPPARLLDAILADAAETAATRAPAPARRRWRPRLRPLDPIGGWGGLAALGACASVGFWVGIAGNVVVEDGAVWAGANTVAGEVAADPVAAFYDLAALEN
jgi:hypothetical protein